ncbi:hypothetical protein CYMTET_21246 [Cymbomonas tetramitiformis]|uniref:Reverse transcriptase domain-containing protein n=1 Tax=Cymbomonas tetramitiformis TaxID=36881 RepID=A0AAE0G2J0_9CHLO|nr:hypothetical protein CYMTET_21246 [Cymbomonas tetramitiformis]
MATGAATMTTQGVVPWAVGVLVTQWSGPATMHHAAVGILFLEAAWRAVRSVDHPHDAPDKQRGAPGHGSGQAHADNDMHGEAFPRSWGRKRRRRPWGPNNPAEQPRPADTMSANPARAFAKHVSEVDSAIPLGREGDVEALHVREEELDVGMGPQTGFDGEGAWTDEEWEDLRSLLRREKGFMATLATDLPGYTDGIGKFDIPFKDESAAHYQKPRRFSPAERGLIDEHFNKLLESDIIGKAPKYCEKTCNVVVAMKKALNDSWTDKRVALDLRGVNELSLRDRTPPLLPEDLFHNIGQDQYMTKLDLRSGFHQILLTDDASLKTCFWPKWPPKDVRGVRAVLGFMNFYRIMAAHIGKDDYPSLAWPLNCLLMKGNENVKDLWGLEHDDALTQLKKRLTEPGVVIHAYDPSRPLRDHSPDEDDAPTLWEEVCRWVAAHLGSRAAQNAVTSLVLSGDCVDGQAVSLETRPLPQRTVSRLHAEGAVVVELCAGLSVFGFGSMAHRGRQRRQDFKRISRCDLLALTKDCPYIFAMVGGTECQDLSAAGPLRGLQGRHSSVPHDVVRVLGQLHHLAGQDRFAYMIECVAAQHNFNSHEVRSVMHPLMCSMIGMPFTVDAARMGSRAHRIRNYWTNMAGYADAQLVLDAVERDPNRLVHDILDSGRTEQDAADDTASGHYPCNVRGEPMRAWPTMMSFPDSYQFRDGRKGTVWDETKQQWGPPTPEEKERAMRFQTGATQVESRHSIAEHATPRVATYHNHRESSFFVNPPEAVVTQWAAALNAIKRAARLEASELRQLYGPGATASLVRAAH